MPISPEILLPNFTAANVLVRTVLILREQAPSAL
jgi:hypothetical protein